MRSMVVSLVLTLLAVAPGWAVAAWVLDGTPVCTQTTGISTVVPDGTGGTIIIWEDGRNPVGWDIYAQRLDAAGNAQWTVNGVALCNAEDYQNTPVGVPDGTGGAVVVWHDKRNLIDSDVYVQLVDASGTPQWTADGVALCTATGDQFGVRIVTDGTGEVIVVWEDYRSGGVSDIYAQRVDASGTPQWAANGVAVCTATDYQALPELVLDGAGGVIIVWQDFRNGVAEDIYAQRLNASGTPLWAVNGVPVCNATLEQLSPEIVADGVGGAVVTWQDFRNGSNDDIYAQRIDGTGSSMWTANGVALCTAAENQSTIGISPDGAGGANVAWRDFRTGSNYDVYAQRVDASGNTQWGLDGIGVCTLADNQQYPVVAQGSYSFIITWLDGRSGTNTDLYAQSVTPPGLLQWTAGGVPVTTAIGNQTNHAGAWDGAGGVVIAWQDYRSGNSQIYAQRIVEDHGFWGLPEPMLDTVEDIPNDQGGKVAVNWRASGRDLSTPRLISHYTIWRAVDEIPPGSAGSPAIVLTDLSRVRADATGPVYARSSNPEYYWELVGTQAAHGWPGYSFSAPTRADSVSAAAATEFFMVAAHDQEDVYVAFPSNVVSGNSVDNLAPSAPLMLMAYRVGTDVRLEWDGVADPDLRDYAVYRAPSPGVAPVLLNLQSSTSDTGWVDADVLDSDLYYVVTANDVHENQSGPSNEVGVGTTSVQEGPFPITALKILSNRPNPFSGSTMFRVGLPTASPLAIDVFDVNGRRVRTQSLLRSEGWQDIRFNGLSDAGQPLPNGMYFYRITAGATTITRKIMIAR